MAIGTSESVGIWPRDINQCTQTIGMDVSTHTKHEFIIPFACTSMLTLRFSVILTQTAAHGARGARYASAHWALAEPETCSGGSSAPQRAAKQAGTMPVVASLTSNPPLPDSSLVPAVLATSPATSNATTLVAA